MLISYTSIERLPRLARLWRVAVDTRKMSFRYSKLFGTASDAVDAIILLRRIKIGNPKGIQILKI